LSTWDNFSLRKIVLFFAAVVMSALFMAITHSTPSFADSATWDGDNIKYGSDTYTPVQNPPIIPGILDSNKNIYQFKAADGTVKIIALESTDKTKEITNAQMGTFTVDSSGNYYTLPGTSPPSYVTIAASTTGGGGASKSSCEISSIGWIICPVSRFIAGGMDKIYDWISGFLRVKPISTSTDTGLYQAWQIVLGVANACFIVAFLVIIYSQITSLGINNYEIKKMIPKLIIAAVLVNASFYVCAIAVDISNILGDSVQNAFVEVRNSLPDPAPQIQWSDLTETILSGGTLVGGLGGLYLAAVNFPALIALLFPTLAIGGLSILVALVVLAARQALIIVLIVVAPLAFVAYLLPNTEKLFEKWRGLFMTMLLVFPMFALLFGGSQLASAIIIQSTDQLHVVILALFVQVAPLALTPFLVRFSGSLLGRLAGMVNNPSKGLVDRTRNWANDRADTMRKAQQLRGSTKQGWRQGLPSAYAYRRESNKRFREGRKKLYDTRLAASDMGQERFQDMLSHTKQAELEQAVGTATGERKYEDAISQSDTLKNYKATQWLEQQRVKQHHAHEDQLQKEAITGRVTPQSHPHNFYAQVAAQAHSSLREQTISENNAAIAEAFEKTNFANELATNQALQNRVGGIDPHGRTKVIAKAKSASYAAKADVVKDIENASDIMPGRTVEMVSEFERGIRDGEVETVRAMINKLAASANQGNIALRDVMYRQEQALANAGMLEEIKFHFDSHPVLNDKAEDMVSWSRQDAATLQQVGNSVNTWRNMTAAKFMGESQATQNLGLSTGGISQSTLRDIMRNPGKVNVKPPILEEIRRQLGVNPDGSQDDTI